MKKRIKFKKYLRRGDNRIFWLKPRITQKGERKFSFWVLDSFSKKNTPDDQLCVIYYFDSMEGFNKQFILAPTIKEKIKKILEIIRM